MPRDRVSSIVRYSVNRAGKKGPATGSERANGTSTRPASRRSAGRSPSDSSVRGRSPGSNHFEETRIDGVARNEWPFVDDVPGRKEITAAFALAALHRRDRLVAPGHVEVLGAAEQMVDLVTHDARRRHEDLIETDSLHDGVPVRARIVVHGAEHFGQSDQAPHDITEVAPDEREDTITLGMQRVSQQSVQDPVHRVRGPWPGRDA